MHPARNGNSAVFEKLLLTPSVIFSLHNFSIVYKRPAESKVEDTLCSSKVM